MKKTILFLKFISLFAVMLTVGCNPQSQVTDGTSLMASSTSTAEATPTANATATANAQATATAGATPTVVKSVASYGSNNYTFNNRTAGVNDIQLNPVTNRPAVAYYDRDQKGSLTSGVTGALKYAYQDATGNWLIEVVDVNYGTGANCGAVNTFCVGAPNASNDTSNLTKIIALGFKSDGTPAIAYVFGASLTTVGNREIRLAERSSSGVWSVSTAYSVTNNAGASEPTTAATINPMMGVTLLFDSSNQPHITFVVYFGAAAVNTNSRIKYSFRNSSSTSGTWTTSDMASAVTAGTITALAAQGSMQGGGAWCSAGSNGTTTPMGVYTYQQINAAAGFGHLLYFYCTSVNASGMCTAWSNLNLVNGCTGSVTCAGNTLNAGTSDIGARSDIAIEPSTNRPIIAFHSDAVPADFINVIYAPMSCASAPTTSAASWSNIGQVDVTSGDGVMNGLQIAAASTADWVVGYNLAATATRVARSTTGILGFAGLAGQILETVAVGSQGVGMAYDTTNGIVYVSYGASPAGAVNATGNDLKVATIDVDDIANGGTQGVAALEIIDQTTGIILLPSTVQFPLLSTAKAPDGTVGYAYVYYDPTAADIKLKYGVRITAGTSPRFMETIVANWQDGTSTSAVVGLTPSLTYDSSSNPIIAFHNGAGTEVNLWVAKSSNGGSTFTLTTVDEIAASVGQFASAVTYGGATGIAYKDTTNTGVKFARWTATRGWTRHFVDASGTLPGGSSGCNLLAVDSGDYVKLAVTSDGKPVIAFQDNTVSATLRIAVANEVMSTASSFTWTCLSLDTTGNAGAGRGEGIGLALDSSDRPHIAHLDYTLGEIRYLTSTLAVGTAVASASNFSITTLATTGIPSAQSAWTAPDVKVNSSGTVYVSYHDKNNRRLALATKRSTDSSFSLETIEQSTDIGGTTSSIVGGYGSMLINSSGYPTMFYVGFENWLKYYSKE